MKSSGSLQNLNSQYQSVLWISAGRPEMPTIQRQGAGHTVGTIHRPRAVFLGLDDLKSSEGRHLDQIQKKRKED